MANRLISLDEGRVLEHQYEEISKYSRIRKQIWLEEGEAVAERAVLQLLAAEYEDNRKPLKIRINDRFFTLIPGISDGLFRWRSLETPPGTWRPGMNTVELSCDELANRSWMLAVENRLSERYSMKSFDEGKTWQSERLGVNYSVQGEYLIRLYVAGPSVQSSEPLPSLIYQPLDHPALSEFDEAERLRELAGKAEGEYAKAAILCSWAGKQWKYSYGTVYTPFALPTLLDWKRNGRGHASRDVRGYCVHYAHLLIQACWVLGIQSRGVALPSYDDLGANGHFVMEAYCKDLGKWVMFDANYDVHLRHNKTPINVAEWLKLRNEGRSSELEVVKGSSFGFNGKYDFFLRHLHEARYHKFSIPLRSDFLSRPDLYMVHHGAIPSVDYHETQFIYYDATGDSETVFPFVTRATEPLYREP